MLLRPRPLKRRPQYSYDLVFANNGIQGHECGEKAMNAQTGGLLLRVNYWRMVTGNLREPRAICSVGALLERCHGASLTHCAQSHEAEWSMQSRPIVTG